MKKVLFTLGFVFSLVFVGSAAFFANSTFSPSSEVSIIEVTLEYIDGTVESYMVSAEELNKVDIDDEELFACTVQFEGGECSTTASNCRAARAGFEACACELGHSTFCADE